MGTWRRISTSSRYVATALALGLAGAALADPPAAGEAASSSDGQAPVPRESIFSSLKQAFKQDFDHEVVRGHFDVGSPPDGHRYYCLVDAKTGKSQANGVPGQLVKRPDGMTGIKATAVSVYSCASAEEQGILVTTGYVLSGAAARTTAPASPTPGPAAAPAPSAPPDASPVRIDVAGVKLGMSVDEVRAVLKAKKLRDYTESMETLNPIDSGASGKQAMGSGRFVNVIAAWTTPAYSPAAAAAGADGESYEVMFTPVPGRERAMAVIHSVAYSPADAVRELALDNGLVKKYGGFTAPDQVPASPTWRIQSSGNVQVGDSCERRGLFGGLGDLNSKRAPRLNLALRTTPDEFRFQIEHCGVAIVTEDHSTANGDAPRADRVLSRFTVTAYSPSIGFEGATAAARLMQTGAGGADNVSAPRRQEPTAPDL
ncbi:MAG: hypothetical protein QOD56_2583 [Gammaproteobacteria bacterium]|nr:hypothetical protein [Gammaproteobacteria bacterium]